MVSIKLSRQFTYTRYIYVYFSGKSTDPIEAEDPKSPVPQEVLCEISCLLRDNVSMKDITDRLRCRTVPSGYKFHTWREGIFSAYIDLG